MCDDHTDAEDFEWLKARGQLSRRGLVGAAAAGAATLAFPLPAASKTNKPRLPLTEKMVAITTGDGTADAFFVHPTSGKHPAILLWPDIGGLREAYKETARRLAASGYAVLAVNHYYRSAKAPVLATFSEWMTDAGRAKIAPMAALLNSGTYSRDAASFVAWLDKQKPVNTRRRVGTVGHCMTGPVTIRTAAAVPDRVGACVSLHGGGLVTDKSDSPHLLIGTTKASYLFAIAQNDDARDPKAKTVLRQTCDQTRRRAEIEVYPAQHGWTALDSPVYDRVQADRAWQRARALFATL